MFHCEWGKGKVFAVKVARDGAGFKFVDEVVLVDPVGVKDFRPFTLRPTADGTGFYVTDWGFSGWLSKVKAGRLWKVTYTKGDIKPAPRGSDADDTAKQIAALDHPAHSERIRAQRELIARKAAADVVAALDAKKLTPRQLRHAAWVVRAGWAAWASVLAKLSEHEDADVRIEATPAPRQRPARGQVRRGRPGSRPRRAGIPVGRRRRHRPPAGGARPHRLRHAADVGARRRRARPRDRSSRSVGTRDAVEAHRRLADVRQARHQPGGVAAEVAAARADQREAGRGRPTASVRRRGPGHDRVVRPGRGRVAHPLAEAAGGRGSQRCVEVLARNAKDREPYAGGWWGTQPAATPPPARKVPWEGTKAVREAPVSALGDADAAVRQAAVGALMTMKDPETLTPLVKRLDEEQDAAAKGDLIRAVAGLGTPKAVPTLSLAANDAKLPEAARVEAIKGLESIGNADAAAAVALAAVECDSANVQARAVEAVGTLKAKDYVPALVKALKNDNAAIRKSAVAALTKFADPKLGERVRPLLADADAGVRLAAVAALGALQDRESIPALLALTVQEATRFDAIAALAKMPDVRAVPAYLTGLASKNNDLRTACRLAVAAIRDPAAKLLEELAVRREIPPQAVNELRTVYSSFAPITSWHLIGPFSLDGKTPGPEKELNFDAKYPGADKEVAWRRTSRPTTGHGARHARPDHAPEQQRGRLRLRRDRFADGSRRRRWRSAATTRSRFG